MTTRPPIVAIDGPAGSGKSTVGRLAASRTGIPFVSSGAMYRGVALLALREGVSAADRDRLVAMAAALDMDFRSDPDGTARNYIAGEDVTDALRTQAVSQVAAIIATIPALREHLVAKQRAYGGAHGIVMEGRDIQTVVFPDADIKVYVDASAEERARRRWKELTAAGEPATYPAVLAEVRARDARDAGRSASPLKAAPDAILLPTDGRGIEQVVDSLVHLIDVWRADPSLRGPALGRAAGMRAPSAGGGGRSW
jgi:cytidylate kinase